MVSCPNINSQEWKDLVKEVGENVAYVEWNKRELAGNTWNEVDLTKEKTESSFMLSKSKNALIEEAAKETTIQLTSSSAELFKYRVVQKGKVVGELNLENDGVYATAINTKINGKPGTGHAAYMLASVEMAKLGLQLRSDSIEKRMTTPAIKMWERFMDAGWAEEAGDHFVFTKYSENNKPVTAGTFQEKALKLAAAWNMSTKGFINSPASNLDYLKQDIAKLNLVGVTAHVTSTGSMYIKRDGKKYNPFKSTTAQKTSKSNAEVNQELRSILLEFLDKLGVTVKDQQVVLKSGDSNAETEFLKKAGKIVDIIIRIAQGKEFNDTLAEETAHVFVELLGENHPMLQEMFELITETEIYQEVLAEYGSDINYKDNPYKLKSEAVGKLLASYLLKQFETVKTKSSPTIFSKLKELVDMILKLFKTVNHDTFTQRLDRVFETAATQILNKDITGLSKDNAKAGLFAQKTGAEYHEQERARDYKFRSEQPLEEKIVSEWKNQIDRLQKQLTPNREADNIFIQGEISKLNERIRGFGTANSGNRLDHLVQYANTDLNEIESMLAKFNQFDAREAARFYLMANQYLEGWKILNRSVDFSGGVLGEEVENTLQAQYQKVSGRAELLQNRLIEIYKEEYNRRLSGTKGVEDFFVEFVDTNFFESQFLNISVSKIPLVQKIYDIVQKANYLAHENTIETNKKIEFETKQLKKWAKDNGISDNELWKIFQQLDSEGKATGNYIHEVSQEFYETKAKLYKEWRKAIDAGNKSLATQKKNAYRRWLNKNTTKRVDKERWEAAKEAIKLRYTDVNGVLDKAAYDKWYRGYEPDGAGDNSDHYIIREPKVDLWPDSRFARIQNTPQLLQYYNFFTELLTERKNALPYNPRLRVPNYLPELYKKGIKEGLSVGNIMQSAGNAVWKTFSAPLPASESSKSEDPTTGMPEKTIPVYMLSGQIKPENKDNNLENILKAFSGMSYLYEQRSQVEPDLLVLRNLFGEVAEQLSNTPQGNINTSRFYEKRKGQSRNTMAALDYFLDASLYDTKTNDPDASKTLTKTIKDPITGKEKIQGFSFTRLAEFLIHWTRRKGMGFNAFAATANLFFGILSTHIESNAEQHFNQHQSNQALMKMLNVALGGKLNAEGKKILLLMDKFDVMKDYMDVSSEGSLINTKKIDKLLFALQGVTENFIYGHTFLSILFNQKITDKYNKERNLYEAYKLVDGELVWDTEEFGAEEFKEKSEQKYQLRQKIERITEDLHGDYNSLNPKLINKTVLGRILMVFRNWLPQGLHTRFASERVESRFGEDFVKKGRLLSYGAYFNKSPEGKRLGIVNLLKDMTLELSKQIINSITFGKETVDFKAFENLTEVDKANMKKNIAALRFTLMLMAVGVIIKGLTIDDDDDNEQSLAKFLLMSIYRVETDLTFYLNPNAQQIILNDFVPLAGTIGDIIEIGDATVRLISGDDIIESGPNAGRSNFIRQTNQAIPMLAQIQRLYELNGMNIEGRKSY